MVDNDSYNGFDFQNKVDLYLVIRLIFLLMLFSDMIQKILKIGSGINILDFLLGFCIQNPNILSTAGDVFGQWEFIHLQSSGTAYYKSSTFVDFVYSIVQVIVIQNHTQEGPVLQKLAVILGILSSCITHTRLLLSIDVTLTYGNARPGAYLKCYLYIQLYSCV